MNMADDTGTMLTVKNKQGTLIYRGGDVISGDGYTQRTMENLPLLKEESFLIPLLEYVKEFYDVTDVVGEYKLSPITQSQSEALGDLSDMENFFFISSLFDPRYADKYPISRKGVIYTGLPDKGAIKLLLKRYLNKINFNLDNSKKTNIAKYVQKGYMTGEMVRLTLEDGYGVIFASVSPYAMPRIRRGRKSRLEEILYQYVKKEDVVITKEPEVPRKGKKQKIKRPARR